MYADIYVPYTLIFLAKEDWFRKNRHLCIHGAALHFHEWNPASS